MDISQKERQIQVVMLTKGVASYWPIIMCCETSYGASPAIRYICKELYTISGTSISVFKYSV